MNFNCSHENVYLKCETSNVNISINDKSAKFKVADTFQNPQEILISSSEMSFIPAEIFMKFRGVKEFIAIDVSIQEIFYETFAYASKLYYLILSHNKIHNLIDFSFRNASNLLSLKLQNNQIEFLSMHTFFGLTELRNLELSHNKIINLSLYLFRDLKSMETLLLDHNFIKVISLYQFERSRDLMTLHLQRNKIVTIDFGTFDNFAKLTQINLNGNVCVDKIFTLWNNHNELSCCTKTFEESENCSVQKIPKRNAESLVIHFTFLILLTFVASILVIRHCCFLTKSNDIFSDSFELISDHPTNMDI